MKKLILIAFLCCAPLGADILIIQGPVKIVINGASSPTCGKLLLENGTDHLLKNDASTFMTTECGSSAILNLLREDSGYVFLEDGSSKLQAEH